MSNYRTATFKPGEHKKSRGSLSINDGSLAWDTEQIEEVCEIAVAAVLFEETAPVESGV